MSRPRVAGGYKTVVTLRVNDRERDILDDLRGGMSRGLFLRWLLIEAARRVPRDITSYEKAPGDIT